MIHFTYLLIVGYVGGGGGDTRLNVGTPGGVLSWMGGKLRTTPAPKTRDLITTTMVRLARLVRLD